MFRPYEGWWDFFTDTPVIYSLGLTALVGVVIPFIVAYFVRWNRERKLAKQREVDSSAGQFNSELITAINYHQKNIAHLKKYPENSEEQPLMEEVHENALKFDQDLRKKEMEEHHKKFVNFKDIDEDHDSSKLRVKTGSVSSSRTSLSSDKENDGRPRSREDDILINGSIDANTHDDESTEILSRLSHMELHGKLATAQLKVRTKKLVDNMSDEERDQERKIREEQLNAIFALMKEQEDKFGIHSKGELNDQLKMYNL